MPSWAIYARTASDRKRRRYVRTRPIASAGQGRIDEKGQEPTFPSSNGIRSPMQPFGLASARRAIQGADRLAIDLIRAVAPMHSEAEPVVDRQHRGVRLRIVGDHL